MEVKASQETEETAAPATAEAESKPSEEQETFTKAQVEEMRKKMQSDSEKWVQKLISEKKHMDSVLEAVKHLSRENDAGNNAALVDIYNENPKVAKEILARYYDGKSIEEFKESIGYREDLSDPKTFERRLEAEKQKAVDAIKVEQAKEAFIKELSLSPEEVEALEEAFQERKQLKTFSADSVRSHLEKAYRLIDKTDTRSLKRNEAAGKAMATSEGRGGDGSPKRNTDLSRIQDEADKFLKKHNR